MQFTGHSLPVHQSMSVPWEFFTSSHFISQFPPTRFPLITAIRMCHLLPVHHLGMAFLVGSKAKIQHFVLLKDCLIVNHVTGKQHACNLCQNFRLSLVEPKSHKPIPIRVSEY